MQLDSVHCADQEHIYFIGVFVISYIKISKNFQNIYKKLRKKYLYLSTFCEISRAEGIQFPLSLHDKLLLSSY